MGRRVLPAALLAAVLVAPSLVSSYVTTFLMTSFLFTAVAYGWNLISGYTGYLSFGHIAFFGIGAYAVGLLTTGPGWHWLPAALAGGLLAAGAAFPIGWLMLRLRGPYFALGMMGLSQILQVIASTWTGLTRGGQGVYMPPVQSLVPLYYVSVALVGGAIAATWLIQFHSSFGLRLMAIRENEDAALAMGVDTSRDKRLAFTLSAVPTAVAGGLYAWFLTYIDPASAFPLTYNLQTILMALFGGAGTVWGPLIGGMFLSAVGEVLWAQFTEIHLALFGVLIVVTVLFLPRGLVGLAGDLARRRRARRLAGQAGSEEAGGLEAARGMPKAREVPPGRVPGEAG